ncbi:hypothetical protein F8M41_011955 [Gigaspora margarita]|uniref:Uncharacterized protein n=1 Tax=Gigaspora margarita TaxID=4874 RepID=A0A8H4ATJ2_GIGMA|nr:hypothetical protein F8M41_011955 [Gigaspora margarita]
MFQAYERTLARIIENQEEILFELKVIKDKVRRIKNRLNDLEQKMDNGFDITNDKAFKEDMIKRAAKALIKKAIYPENSQIKSETEKYIRENYAEYFEKFTLKDWNIYYANKRPRVVDLDPEEVQEAENDLDEDVDKEKNTDDYEKNTDNNK